MHRRLAFSLRLGVGAIALCGVIQRHDLRGEQFLVFIEGDCKPGGNFPRVDA
jgi:hypothetical protein